MNAHLIGCFVEIDPATTECPENWIGIYCRYEPVTTGRIIEALADGGVVVAFFGYREPWDYNQRDLNKMALHAPC